MREGEAHILTYPIEKVGEEFRILKIPREKICRN
jgi:hypothetical protein